MTKKNPNVIGSFTGAFLGVIYTLYNYFAFNYTSYTNVLVYLIANILYFSLIGFLIAVIYNLSTKSKRIQRWHVGALLGFISFLIILLFSSIKSSGFMCRSLNTILFDCSFSQFINLMILEGPFPLHMLQVFLILLGMLIGLVIGNNQIMRKR